MRNEFIENSFHHSTSENLNININIQGNAGMGHQSYTAVSMVFQDNFNKLH